MPLRTGLSSLLGSHLDPANSIAIAGEAAAATGERLALAGGPPLTIEADSFALLSDDLSPPSVGRIRDLPEACLDAAVLRRAWVDPGEIRDALSAAMRAVRPGGAVVATDIDADRLLTGPSPRYPIRLLYLAEPAAAARLRETSASAPMLGVAAVRAGLRHIDSVGYDEVRGEYDNVAALWAAVRERGWRGAAWVASERLGPLYESVAPSLAKAVPGGVAVDREPWHAVVGRVR